MSRNANSRGKHFYASDDSWDLPVDTQKKEEAGLLRRLFAAGIDFLVIVFLVMGPMSAVFQQHIGTDMSDSFALAEEGLAPQITFAMALIVVLMLAYFVLFQFYYGQTVGMMALRISISGNAGFGKSLLRSMIVIPAFPFYLLWIVEPLLLLFGKKPLLEQLTKTGTVVLTKIRTG